MSGKELRREAWSLCREKRGFLIGASLLGFLPAFAVGMILEICQAATGRTLSGWWYAPGQIVFLMFSLGLARLVLRLADGGEKRLGELIFFFQGEYLGQALLVSLFLYVATYVPVNLLDLVPTPGNLLGSLISFLIGGLVFPVQYYVALFPRDGAKRQILQGVGAGREAYFEILGYVILTSLPMIGVTVVFMVIILLWPLTVFLLLPAYIAALIFLLPYMYLAYARYAKELIRPEPPPPGEDTLNEIEEAR